MGLLKQDGGGWTDGAGRLSRRGWTLVGAMTALALVIRLIQLDCRGLWLDELYTLRTILLPLDEMIAERLRKGHLPLYFLFLQGWAGLFGTSDLALRLPSVIAGALILPAVAWAANGRIRVPILFGALALIAANGVAMDAARMARMYSILSLLVVVALGLQVRALEAAGAEPGCGRARRLWAGWLATVLIGAVIQPLMLLFASALLLAQAFRLKATRAQRTGGLAVALCLGLSALGGALLTNWFNRKLAVQGDLLLLPWSLLKNGAMLAFGERGPWEFFDPLRTGVGGGFLLLMVPAAWRQLRGRTAGAAASYPPERDFLLLCGVGAGAAFLAFSGLALVFDGVSGAKRYLSPLVAPVSLVVAAGIAWLPPRLARLTAGVVAVTVLLGMAAQWQTQDSGARTILRYIAKKAEPGDVVVANRFAAAWTAAEHYLPDTISRRPVPVPYWGEEPDPVILKELQQVARRPEVRRVWIFTYNDPDNRIAALARQYPELLQLDRTKRTARGEAYLYRVVK